MTADDTARDMCRVIDDMPVDFVFGGTTYQGIRGALVNSKRVMEGGIFEEPELAITTTRRKVNSSGKLVTRFSTLPVSGQVIRDVNGDGVDYRIVKTHKDHFGDVLQMDLESMHK